MTAGLTRATRASLDAASTRTRSLARASLRAIGLERMAGGGGGGDGALSLTDRRVLQVGLEEWRDDAALRASVNAGDGHGKHATPPSGADGAGAGGAAAPPPAKPSRFMSRRTLLLAYSAVGVVFGDISTSPLYVLSSVFAAKPPNPEEVAGAVSIVAWTLTLILVLKYTLVILRADDAGQGGTFALYALLRRQGAEAGADKATAGLGPGVYTRGPTARPSMALRVASSLGRASPLTQTSMRRRGVSTSSGIVGPELDRASAPAGPGGGPRFPRSAGSSQAPGLPAVPSGKAVSGEAPTPAAAEAGRVGTPPPPPKDWRQRFIESGRVQAVLRVMVAVGVAALIADGVITPAISITSAAEGLATAFPSLPKDGGVVLGVAIGILALLFAGQQFGTGAVSAAFSPVGLAWLATLVGVGAYNLAVHATPATFAALSPHHAWLYFARDGAAAWRSLGSLALAITGAEALYADLGHFSRPSIQAAALCLVYPALLVAYLGQGALLTARPEVHANVFWSSVPKPVFWPVWVVATLATVVASQALISAAFSIVSQAIRQRFVPRLRIVHTSRTHEGQIYIPAVNWLLAILVRETRDGRRGETERTERTPNHHPCSPPPPFLSLSLSLSLSPRPSPSSPPSGPPTSWATRTASPSSPT